MGAYVAVRVVEEKFLGKGVGKGSQCGFRGRVGAISHQRIECNERRCENDVLGRLIFGKGTGLVL